MSSQQDTISNDEVDVRALYRKLIDGWNKRDAGAYAEGFAEDGSVVGFDGSQLNGRGEVEAALRQIFAAHETAAYVYKIREVRTLSAESALLRAVVGMVPAGTAELNPALNAVQSLVAVKQGRKWWVALFQNTPAQFHGRPELAEQLTEELRALLK